jgi:hypothetical protein
MMNTTIAPPPFKRLVKMTPKPYSSIKAKFSKYSSPNIPPKWKRKKNKLKELGKLPAPRSLGHSKTDRVLLENIGASEYDTGLEQPKQQGGIVEEDPEYSESRTDCLEPPSNHLYDFKMNCICMYMAYSQRVEEDFFLMEDVTTALHNHNKQTYRHMIDGNVEFTELYLRYLDNSHLLDLDEIYQRMLVLYEMIGGLTQQTEIYEEIMEHVFDNEIISKQGGHLSYPVEMNFDFDRANDLVGQSKKSADDVVTKVREMFEEFSNKPITMEHTVKNPFKDFNLMEFLFKHRKIVAVIVVAFSGYLAYTKGGYYIPLFSTISGGVMGMLMATAEEGEYLHELMTFFEKHIEGKSEITPQGGFDFNFVEMLSKTAIAGILGSFCTQLKSESRWAMVCEFFQKTSNIRRIGDGVKFTLEFILKLVQDFMNWIGDFANLKKVKIVDDPFWEISIFGETVHSKRVEYVADPLKDSTFAGELSQLRAEGEEIRSRLCKMPNNAQQLQVLSGYLRELNDLILELNSKLVTVNGTRPEPFMFLALGGAGIGKTTFVNCLIPEITAETLPLHKLDHFVDHPGEYLHTYNETDDFWSGYHGQHNLVIDEFGFRRDANNGQPTIWSEIIQMINVNPMNLNMADLNSKGRVYFRSKNVWGTSNLRHFNDIQSIIDKEAVFRRLSFTWVVAVREEFATECTRDKGPWDRKPDWDYINNADQADNFGYLEFFRMTDLQKHIWNPVSVGKEELKVLILEQMRRSAKAHLDLNNKIDRSVSSVVARRKKEAEFIQKQDGYSCGVCPSCNKEMYRLTGETNVAYAKRLFSAVEFNENTIRNPNIPRVTELDFMTIYCDRTWDATYEPLAFTEHVCAFEQQYPETIISHMAWWSEKNRANAVFGNKGGVTWIYKMASYANVVGRALAIGVPMFFLLKYVRSFFGEKDGDEEVSPEHGDYPMRKKTKSKKKPNSVKALRRIQVQAGDDPNAHNIITKLVTRNVWRFKIDLGENKSYQGCVLALQNNVVLMPEHYIGRWMDYVNGDPENGIEPRPDIQITFTNCTMRNPNTGEIKPHFFTKSLKDLLYSWSEGAATIEIFKMNPNNGEDDVGVCYIPGITGRSILKLFRSKDQKLPTQHRGVLGVLNRDCSPVYHTANFVTRNDVVYADGEWGCEKGIMYDIPTRVGDCGSPFVIFDKTNEAKIASIHVAGVGNTKGIGAVVDKEGLELAVRTCCTFNNIMRDIAEEAAAEEVKPLVQSGVVFGADGRVYEAIGKPIPQTKKTTIVPSPINGLIDKYPPRKKPAMLRTTDGIDPMANAMWGYGLSHIRPNMHLYGAAIDDYCHELFNTGYIITNEMRRALTFKECVMGIPGEEFIDSINRGSSPGWPMKHLLKGGAKSSAFGSDDFTFDTPDALLVEQQMGKMEESILSGIRPYVVNNHFLKDELRTIEKSDAGKTRLISSCDLTFGLLVRKYTLMFSAFVMRSRVDNGICCGMNPYSGDWQHLATRHGNNADNYRVIAGDFSGYDKTLAPEDIWTIKVVMLKFYQDEETDQEKIRNALIDEIAQSRHLVDKLIYAWMGANTSGNPLTVVINSVAGCVLDRYAILNNYPEPVETYVKAVEILVDMRGHVKISKYGDDGLLSVQIYGPFEFITQEFMTEAYAKLGMVYTDEAKGIGVVSNERRLVDCTFLKRGFIRSFHCDKKRWMANLSLDTILESIQWTKEKDLGYQFWKDNVLHMLMELSAHGKDTFREWAGEITHACARSDEHYTVVCPAYNHLQDKFVTTDLSY